ncbi:MAG: hypothetical protein KF708_07345 [Pirellulales bacterium]|nr:hypothetical protein [Pirellulales bacterium]
MSIEPLEERALLAVFHVSEATGFDTNDGSAANPFRSIQAALVAAATTDDGDDHIKVEEGTYDSAVYDLAIDMNASDELDNLKLEGGYVAGSGFATRDTVNNPTIYVPQGAGAAVTIGDANVTLDGFQFTFDGTADGVVVAADDATLIDLSVTNAKDGISAASVANLTINGVKSNNNFGDGFSLTAMTGTLTIDSSEAISNVDWGLLVSGADSVGVSNFNAGVNGGGGLSLTTSATGAVDLSDVNASSHGLQVGISLGTVGDVTATNVTSNASLQGLVISSAASFTDTDGTYSNNRDGGIQLSTIGGAIELTNTSADNNNTDADGVGDGLVINTSATSNVTISGGSYSANRNGIVISASASLSSSSVTADNNSDGIGLSAAVTGNATITAGSYNGNGTDGIRLNVTTGDVLINGGATASSNGDHGIQVTASAATGDVTITSVTASGNDDHGILVNSAALFSGTSITANDNDDDNNGTGNGLRLLSIDGAVTLDDVTALENATGLTVDGAGSFSDTNGNYSNNDDGGIVLIAIAGTIELTNTTADANNFDADFVGDGLTVNGSATSDITITDGSYSNNRNGILIASSASLTSDSVTVDNNSDGYGLMATVTGNATITAGSYDSNGFSGLRLDVSSGDVSITGGTTANDNGDHGIQLTASAATGDVTITSVTASDNNDHGILVNSARSFTGTNITANDNDDDDNGTGDGLHLLSITGAVTLNSVTAQGNDPGLLVNGAGSFSDTDGNYSNNNDGGIVLIAIAGTIELTNTTADNNNVDADALGDGLNISSSPTSNITISGGSYSGNVNGIVIASSASLDIDSVTVDDNTAGYGLQATVSGNATITAGSYSNNLGGDGAKLTAGGDVSIDGGSFVNNFGDGAEIDANGNVRVDNFTLVSGNKRGMVVIGAASFSDTDGNYLNNDDGGILLEDIAGNVTLTRTVADNNDFDGNGTGDGVRATKNFNAYAIGGALNVLGAKFRDTNASLTVRQQSGLFVEDIASDVSIGNSGLDNTVATSNVQYGVRIKGVDTNLVTVSDANLSNNGGDGAHFENILDLTVTSVTASDNGGHGFLSTIILGAVKFEGGQYNGNSLNGIDLFLAPGTTVELNDVTAGVVGNGNGGVGFKIDSASPAILSLILEDLSMADNDAANAPNDVGGLLAKPVTSLLYRPSSLPANVLAADLVELTGTHIAHTRNGVAQQRIGYASIGTMTVSTLDGDDTINVRGDLGAIPITDLDLFAGSGNDQLKVIEPAAGAFPTVDIFGETGQDNVEIFLGRAGIATTMSFDGGVDADWDTFTVYTRSAANSTITIDHAQVVALVPGTKTINYANVSGLNVVSNGGHDHFTINESLAPAHTSDPASFPRVVGVYGQNGNDTVTLNLGRHASPTSFNVVGGAGVNELRLFTHNDSADQVVMTESAITNVLKTVSYAGLNRVNIDTKGGDDSVSVIQPAVGTFPSFITLETQAGNDSISIRMGLPTNATLFDIKAGTGADDRLVVSTGSGHADVVNINNERIETLLGPVHSAEDVKLIKYAGIDYLKMSTAGGKDTITVSSTGTPPLPKSVHLFTEDEDDSVTINMRNIGPGNTVLVDGGNGNDFIVANLPADASLAIPPKANPNDPPQNMSVAINAVFPDLRIRGGAGDADKFVVRDVLGRGTQMEVDNESSGARLTVDTAIECVQYYGFDGNDHIRHLAQTNSFMDGGLGDDTLTGGNLADLIFGGAGKDRLIGGPGDDYLFADFNAQGVETIDSGDYLDPGTGFDTYVSRGIDHITGFEVAEGEQGRVQQDGATFDVIFWLIANFNKTEYKTLTAEALLGQALSKTCAQKLDFTPSPG